MHVMKTAAGAAQAPKWSLLGICWQSYQPALCRLAALTHVCFYFLAFLAFSMILLVPRNFTDERSIDFIRSQVPAA